MSLFDDTDLFTPGKSEKRVFHLEDATVILYSGFFDKPESDRLYTSLLPDTKWQQEAITVYNKTHLQPRLTAWYGDDQRSYTYSGTKMEPFPWTPDLLFIKSRVEKEVDTRFTSVLLNLYRDGKDGVGWHRDNERSLGPVPVIASLSFGGTRIFQFRKYEGKMPVISLELDHGSLVLMKGETQRYWEHRVTKTSVPVAPRINLTFRSVKTT